MFIFLEQVDWFAERRINWHIAVSFFQYNNPCPYIWYIYTAQDASVTFQIMIDVARDIMMHRHDAKYLHFFSDNAGCYKSSYTLLSLHQELSDSIVSYNFCEAQNGKGITYCFIVSFVNQILKRIWGCTMLINQHYLLVILPLFNLLISSVTFS